MVKMKKRMLSIFVVLCMVLSMSSYMVSHAEKVVNVTNYAELKAALEADYSGEGENSSNPTMVVITAPIDFTTATGAINIGARYKTIVSASDVTISRGTYTGLMFNVENGSILNIGSDGYSGRLTFDGMDTLANAMFQTRPNSAINVHAGTFQNCNAYHEQCVFRIHGGALTLEQDVLIQNNVGNDTGGAIFINGWDDSGVASVTVNGATFTNNKSYRGGVVAAVNGGNVIINDGLFEKNAGGSSDGGNVAFLSGGSKLTMNGGIIDGAGTIDPGADDIRVQSSGFVYLNGGTIKNTALTAVNMNNWWEDSEMTVGESDGSSTFNFINCGSPAWDGGAIRNGNGGNALLTIHSAVFDNCNAERGGAIKNQGAGSELIVNDALFINCKSSDGGSAIRTENGGKVTINGGEFDRNAAPVIHSFNNGVLTITGGVFKNGNGGVAVNHNGASFSMGGDVQFSSSYYLNLNGKTIDMISALSTDGAVADIKAADGVTVLSGDYITENHEKFGALYNSGNDRCGVDSDGDVASAIAAPAFTVSLDDEIITLGFAVRTATVQANYNVGEAALIAASYGDGGKTLLSVEVFDVDVTMNTLISKNVSSEFITNGIVKVMLWDTPDTAVPLATAYSVDLSYDVPDEPSGERIEWNDVRVVTDFNGGSNLWSNAIGATITVTFTGTSISMYGTKDNTHGIVEVKVDNMFNQKVDTYGPSVGAEKLFTVSGLTDGAHTLVLTILNEKNEGSTNYYTDCHYFIINGED